MHGQPNIKICLLMSSATYTANIASRIGWKGLVKFLQSFRSFEYSHLHNVYSNFITDINRSEEADASGDRHGHSVCCGGNSRLSAVWKICALPYLLASHNDRTCSSFLPFAAVQLVEASWNVMAHAQKPYFFFRRNRRVHLNRRGRQFSRLLAAEVCISGSNAGYSMFRGSVKGSGYPLHSPISPSLTLPCVTVCHHISAGVYLCSCGMLNHSAGWFVPDVL